MTQHQAGSRNTFRRLSAACLAAVGLSSPGCARGPETVVPRPLKGGWMELHDRYVERAKRGHIDLLFIGDSITYFWNQEIWERYYGPRNAEKFGIGGDKTQQVLWRVRNGEIDGIRPKVVVLLVGTNNLTDNTVEEIAQGIGAIVQEVRERLPETRILLLGIFPRSEKPDALRAKLRAVNARIAGLDDGSHVKFLDIGEVFVDDDGTISREIMPDSIHLTRQGYRLWADAMEPTLRSMVDESR